MYLLLLILSPNLNFRRVSNEETIFLLVFYEKLLFFLEKEFIDS